MTTTTQLFRGTEVLKAVETAFQANDIHTIRDLLFAVIACGLENPVVWGEMSCALQRLTKSLHDDPNGDFLAPYVRPHVTNGLRLLETICTLELDLGDALDRDTEVAQ